MLGKKHYNNGQKVYELTENTLSYFYKNGNLKATGPFINEFMEGEWLFYRESGQLWQVGNFEKILNTVDLFDMTRKMRLSMIKHF